MSRRAGSAILPLSVLLALAAAEAIPARAEFHEAAAFEARSLVVENLIGEIRVQGASGSKFEVEVTVRGRDASPDAVRIEKIEGESASLTIRFPVDRQTDFVYPALGSRSSTTIQADSGGDQGWVSRLLGLGRGRIHVSGVGSGMEVWADAVVKVPAGKTLEVRHGVGSVVAADVEGELTLEIRSGGVQASSIRGPLSIDTGSGDVRVEDATGRLSIDTGSGDVKLSHADADDVAIDTGSGEVDANEVTCDRLSIDTGSGGVQAGGVRAGSVSIDTGSGAVELALETLSDGNVEIDTGSGSITLVVPGDASAQVDAETGSGGIRVGLDGIRVVRQERDEMQFQIGGGAARVTLETGSGGIEIRPAG